MGDDLARRSSSKRLRILFAEGSSLSARQTLYALARRHEVDIIDPTRLCLCRFSSHVRRWYRCPSFSRSPEAYLDFLIQRLEKGKYDVLFPTHEQVYLVSRFRDRLSKYAHIAVPDFEVIERTQSKIGFIRLMEELGLPYPATAVLRDEADLDRHWDYPCYFKLAHGTAGNTVRLVHDDAELQAAFNDFRTVGGLGEGNEFLVQQPAVGAQCTVQAVFDSGRLLGAHCTQTTIVGTGGGNLARVGVSHPQVIEHAAMFGRHLNWHGALFIEYFYDAETDSPQYYECNPRIGETVNAYLSGVDLAEAVVQMSMGTYIEALGESRPGLPSHCGFMVLMDMGRKGASRRQLFQKWKEIRARQGIFEGSEDELTRPAEDSLSILPFGWIISRLFANPAVAREIVRQTVDNYSLPEEAADRIRDLPSRAKTATACPDRADHIA